MSTLSGRAELIDTLTALLERARSGDVETIALVVVSESEGMTALLIGEDQSCPVTHALGLACMSMCCELVDEANGDDVLPGLAPDGVGNDDGSHGAN